MKIHVKNEQRLALLITTAWGAYRIGELLLEGTTTKVVEIGDVISLTTQPMEPREEMALFDKLCELGIRNGIDYEVRHEHALWVEL